MASACSTSSAIASGVRLFQFTNTVFGANAGRVPLPISEMIDKYVTTVLMYGQDWPIAAEIVKAEPRLPFGWLLNTDLMIAAVLPQHASESLASARKLVEESKDSVVHAPDSLPDYISAYEAWLGGDLVSSARAFEKALTVCPDDLFALKRAQLLFFLAGQPADMLRVSDTVRDRLDGSPFYHGMVAFAHEQVGNLELAESEGRRGVEIRRDDAWSHHAVAHALYFGGRLPEGVVWLESLAPEWERCCSFMLTHNWWHVALNKLEMGSTDEVFRLYDERVWGVMKSELQDQMGALGLLFKLHIRQVSKEAACSSNESTLVWPDRSPAVSDRLQDVLKYAIEGVPKHADPFFDVLMSFAFSAMKDSTTWETLEATAQEAISKLPEPRKSAVGPVWIGCMRALHAFGEEDYASAASYFDEVVALAPASTPEGVRRMHTAGLGNSSEQRDCLEEAYVLALLRCGRHRDAATVINCRLKDRPRFPSELFSLAIALRGQGQHDKALEVIARATELETEHRFQLSKLVEASPVTRSG